MSEKHFLIIDNNLLISSKLNKYLTKLNFDSFILHKEFESIEKVVQLKLPDLIFANNTLLSDSKFRSALKDIWQKYSIPTVIIYKDDLDIVSNNINPDYTKDYLSGKFNLHELQLVIEKALNNREEEIIIPSDIIEETNHYKIINERYSYIFEHTGLGIFQSTLKGKFISVNKAFAKILGYSSPKELTESIDNISSQIYLNTEERNSIIETLKVKKILNNYKVKCRRKDGIIIMLKVHYRLLMDSISKKEYIEGIAEDYTYHNRAKDALKDNILQLKESYKLARLASFQKDCLLNKYSFSENFFEILDIKDETKKSGFNEKTLFEITHPEDQEILMQIWTSGISQKLHGFKASFRIIGDSGKFIHINLDSVLQYNKKFEVVNIYAAVQDITEQKMAEEQLKVALAEKEVLLREINHRVKNNLQVVSSILNLQSGYIKDKKTIEILKECKNRVFSMSLVHEKLCQTDNLAFVDYKVYLKELLSNIIQTYNLNKTNITVKLEMDDVFFPFDIAIPCGMIINELVSNAVKYAFPDNNEGEIKVEIIKIMKNENQENQEWQLNVIDNGIGFSDNFDKDNTETLGLNLVNSLVDQINGSIEFINDHGVKVSIHFKEK